MKIGDKVKLIKGNPFGIIGVINQITLMSRPVAISSNERETAPVEEYFVCIAEDGTEFSGWADDLELLE